MKWSTMKFKLMLIHGLWCCRPFDPTQGLSFVTFPEAPSDSLINPSDAFKVELLYRPGHYDVLYHR